LKIRLEDRLPFVTVKLGRGTEELVLERVLLDTGSATTVFAVDEIALLGIVPEPTDRIRRLVGVGGTELVLAKRIESLALGAIQVQDFPIQIGAMKRLLLLAAGRGSWTTWIRASQSRSVASS
jgi:hypothetical protein